MFARKTHSMYLIKDLRIFRELVAFAIVFIGVVLFIGQSTKYFYVGSISLLYIFCGLGLVIIGFFILRSLTTTVSIINRELRVLTINKRNLFTSSYVQYGFDEIDGALTVNTEHLIGQMFPISSVDLFLKESGKVALIGKTYLLTDEVIDIVSEANQYLERLTNSTQCLSEA